LWVDALWQQVTGFTVLGLSVVGLSMSLRKRVPTVRFGHFDWWRVLHIAMGVMALVALFIHTGLHLGTNVGLALVSCFLGILLLGSLNGMMALSEKHWRWPFMHRLGPSLRYLHIAVAWPLPALLGVHIAAVYYF
jgi:nitrite reductase (NADH) large subunit